MPSVSTTSLRMSFRNIRMIVVVLLVFLLVQAWSLFVVWEKGQRAIGSLNTEGLPSLKTLAAAQEQLALYRLHSYEWLFAQEKAKGQVARIAEEKRARVTASLADLKKLFPSGPAAGQVADLERAFTGVVATFTRIRSMLDSDFEGAMKLIDTELPAKVAKLASASDQLQATCLTAIGSRSEAVSSAFATIQKCVFSLGPASVCLAGVAVLMVTLLARRTRRTMAGITENLWSGSDDVTAAATQMAETSRKLASSGSTQAASAEQTSSSLEEIRIMVQRNSEHANRARDIANEARQAAEGGASEMSELTQAMDDIKASSDTISNILKNIDEIAFQTNLLALNAAIEAARAGEAGLGFAVVADEVRALAHRASSAARETAVSIEESLRRSARGVVISQRVAGELQKIVEKARDVDRLISDIAGASTEQSRSIVQVNAAMNQVDSAAQTIAVEAQQSASASAQLNSQARHLRATVEALVSFVDTRSSARPSDPSHPTPKHPSAKAAATNGDTTPAAGPEIAHPPSTTTNGAAPKAAHGGRNGTHPHPAHTTIRFQARHAPHANGSNGEAANGDELFADAPSHDRRS